MSYIRIISRASVSALLKLGLVLFPVVLGIVMIGSPAQFKDAVRASGIYDTFVGSVLNQSTRQASDIATKTLLSDSGVRNAIQKAYSPQVVQTTSEQIIDSYYGWLEGATAVPSFKIDLTTPQANLASNLTGYAEQKAATLPECSFAQLKQLSVQPDILTIPCLPPGVNVRAAAEQFTKDVISNTEFLNNPILTNESLLGTNVAENNFSNSQAPKTYQLSRMSLWILGGLIVCMMIGVVYLHGSRRQGVRSVALSLIACAVFLLIGVVLYVVFFRGLVTSSPSIDTGPFQQSFVRGLTSLADIVNRTIALISGVYLAVGGVAMLLLRRPVSKPAAQK